MQNSKNYQMCCNQFELFKDKKFQFIPSLKQIKVEQVNHQEQIFNESSAEDIFEKMGNKDSNQEQLQQQISKENKINKNDDWKSYYNLRLKEIKLERPELNHNQMTQLISDEWKMIKKQFTKVHQYFNQDEDIINKKRLKQIKDNSKFYSEITTFEKQESELDFNPFECAKFIENLRQKKFKLVINEMTYELPGIAIIEAIDNDSILIYLSNKINNNNNITNTNTTQGTPNEKINASLENIGSDSEQSICKGNDDFILQNNIRSFL